MAVNIELEQVCFTLVPSSERLLRAVEDDWRVSGCAGIREMLCRAVSQGVLGLALQHLTSLPHAQLPPGTATAAANKLAHLLSEHTQLSIDLEAWAACSTPEDLRIRVDAVRALYQREFQHVIGVLSETMWEWAVIKGLAVARYYPAFVPRDSWDIDVYVKDFDSATMGALALLQRGCVWDDISVKRVGAAGFGWKLHLFSPRGIPIEFHIGPLQAYAGGVLLCRLLDQRTTSSLDGTTFPAPAPHDQLLYLVGHAYRHGFISEKDTNDTHVLLNVPGVDPGYACQCARQSHLAPVLFEILNRVMRRYGSQAAATFQEVLQPGLCERRDAASFGRQTRTSGRCFQGVSLPAQARYLWGFRQEYGTRRALSDIRHRITFGLERQIFPEKDARRVAVPARTVRLHNWLFGYRPLTVHPFLTAYFRPLPEGPTPLAQELWRRISSAPRVDGFPGKWCIARWAERLFVVRANGKEFVILTPFGFAVPVDYFKSAKIDFERVRDVIRDFGQDIADEISEPRLEGQTRT